MHARVTTFQLKPGKLDELLKITRESIAPVVKQQKGIQRAIVLKDRKANRVIAITLWDTEADLGAMDTSGSYQKTIDTVAHVLDGEPVREIFEARDEI